uniref:thioesterase II family protein n=1 Tax=Corynebacterium casei TaxID=160386 RepID=UPI000BF0ECFA|nr:thioesterase domain-containing protein [Corynebacterium casei]
MRNWNVVNEKDEMGNRILVTALPAGASPNHYRMLFPSSFEHCVLELAPSREFRGNTDVLLKRISKELEFLQPRDCETVVLFGHSLGSGLALALAHFIAVETHLTPRVFLSGVPKPGSFRVSPEIASDYIVQSLGEILPGGEEVPSSFREMIYRQVVADFGVVEELAVFAAQALNYVEVLLAGSDDDLCTEADIIWWRSKAPAAEVFRYEGDHFGYMKSKKIADLYRSVASDLVNEK